jgi:carbon monoxide dehydrogenase subunit G
MNIEGTYTLQASPEDVWNCLMNQQILLRSIPGIQKLEKVDENTYALAMHIKYAPLKDSYHGHITLTEQQYPYHYRIAIQGEGRQNTITGSGSIHLNERNNNTVIAYQGTLTLGKSGVLLPASVVKGAAKLLIQQFFSALSDQLRINGYSKTVAPEEIAGASVVKQSGGSIVILPPASVVQGATKTTLSRTIVHWFGLGEGDPVQEERWESNIRRISIISGLLFLVWIGTRLPRRR